ncbi:MAG: GtrA family protein [Armatimonadota bacterium]
MIGGAGGALVNILTSYTLTEKLKIYYLYSVAIGGVGNITFNFFFHRFITFKVTDKPFQRYVKIFVVNIFYGILTLLAVRGMVEIWHINYNIALIIAIIIFSVINFIANKLWVFAASRRKNTPF